jgi:hypothetical protein
MQKYYSTVPIKKLCMAKPIVSVRKKVITYACPERTMEILMMRP